MSGKDLPQLDDMDEECRADFEGADLGSESPTHGSSSPGDDGTALLTPEERKSARKRRDWYVSAALWSLVGLPVLVMLAMLPLALVVLSGGGMGGGLALSSMFVIVGWAAHLGQVLAMIFAYQVFPDRSAVAIFWVSAALLALGMLRV